MVWPLVDTSLEENQEATVEPELETGQPWLAHHKGFVFEIVAVVAVDFLLVMAVLVVMPVVVVFALVVVSAVAVR